MSNENRRRPLKVRGTRWSKSIASYLSKKSITPNQISVASIFFAIFILLIPSAVSYQTWLSPILAALFIQMILLCNLFDGMVALEGAKSTKSGELYNDIPDRVSDSIIFIALIIIALGSFVTVLNRTYSIYKNIEGK